MRSAALRARLQETEGELERLKAAAWVVDVKAILAAIPAAVARYREKLANLGAMKDIEAGREINRGSPATSRCPGVDGVPVPELALSEAMPLGVAVGSDLGVVAGACYPLIYHIYIRLIRPEKEHLQKHPRREVPVRADKRLRRPPSPRWP
jgi:hypothetical protein